MLAPVMTQAQIDEALDGCEHLERVEIELVERGFNYRLFGDGGRQILAGVAPRVQLAEMLLVTEVLLNPELGIRGRRLSLVGSN